MQIGHRSGQQQGRHQGCGKGQGDEAGLPVGRSGRRHKNTAGQPQGHRHRDQCGQQHHRHHFQQHRGGQQGQGEVDKRIRHEAQAQQAAQHRQRRQQPQPPVAQGLAQPLRVLIGQQQRGGQHRQGAEYRALVPGQRQRDHLLPPEHAKTERSQPGGQRLRQHTAQQQQAQQGSWRAQGRVGQAGPLQRPGAEQNFQQVGWQKRQHCHRRIAPQPVDSGIDHGHHPKHCRPIPSGRARQQHHRRSIGIPDRSDLPWLARHPHRQAGQHAVAACQNGQNRPRRQPRRCQTGQASLRAGHGRPSWRQPWGPAAW